MSDASDELIALGYQARKEGRLQQAREIFTEAVGLCRSGADQSALASSLVGLGQIERDFKNNRAAIQHYREAADIYRSEANRLRLAHTIRHLADILREDGSLDKARPQ